VIRKIKTTKNYFKILINSKENTQTIARTYILAFVMLFDRSDYGNHIGVRYSQFSGKRLNKLTCYV